MTNPDFDPLTAVAIVLALVLGPRAAPLASVYATILIGGFCGILVGLRKREGGSRLGAASFCFTGMCSAVFTTVPLSELLGHSLSQGGTWLFFPVSLLVAAYHYVWLAKLRDLGVRLLDALGQGGSNVR